MTLEVELGCRDTGKPGCLGTIDPVYTMDFEDIGKGKIYWCSACGKEAQEVTRMLEDSFCDPIRGPQRMKSFGRLMDEATEKAAGRRS